MTTRPYLDLDRRFLLYGDSPSLDLELMELVRDSLTWTDVLLERFAVIVAAANYGKTTELKAMAERLRTQDKSAVFVRLHEVFYEGGFQGALDTESSAAFEKWSREGDELTIFVDSLDEATLTKAEGGLRRALKQVLKHVKPGPNVRWVLSSRPAVLTPGVLKLLQSELGAEPNAVSGHDSQESPSDFDEAPYILPTVSEPPDASSVKSDNAGKVENVPVKRGPLKIFRLLQLGSLAAERYLSKVYEKANAAQTLKVARQYGLHDLCRWPGGLDILSYMDLETRAPTCLTDVYENMVGAIQMQQRWDRREQAVGVASPENVTFGMTRLACASVVCQLKNIALPDDALPTEQDILCAAPLVAGKLTGPQTQYLLGSHLFTDSGHDQVKVYPDAVLWYLAAKRLATLVNSPEDAKALLAHFTWDAPTSERGVFRSMLPIMGWLTTLCPHSRKVLSEIEPQAFVFFGDMRNNAIELGEAARNLERAIERFVTTGDSIGRKSFSLTPENYWQVGKDGIAPSLLQLFEKYQTPYARYVLLQIAKNSRLDVLRESILKSHDNNYQRLMADQQGLDYVLALEREDDAKAITDILTTQPGQTESIAAEVLQDLAWKTLDARSMVKLAFIQIGRQFGGHNFSWALRHQVVDAADDGQLSKLTRTMLWRLLKEPSPLGGGTEIHRRLEKLAEATADLIAAAITRSVVSTQCAAQMCARLNNYTRDKHVGDASVDDLRSALQSNKQVRIEFLRAIVNAAGGTNYDLSRAIYASPQIYTYIDGDERALGVDSFTQLIEERNRRVAMTAVAPPRQKAMPDFDEKSKTELTKLLDGMRDASDPGPLTWMTRWLLFATHQHKYSECDIGLVEQAAGLEIAQAAAAGFKALWRKQEPKWDESQPTNTFFITIAGLFGLYLDLGDGDSLPALNDAEVRYAIRYAQFEINGYPKWFWPLVSAHAAIAIAEFQAIIKNVSLGAVSKQKGESLIRNLTNAPEPVSKALAKSAWQFIRSNSEIAHYDLEAGLRVADSDTGVIEEDVFAAEALRQIVTEFSQPAPDKSLVANHHDEYEQINRRRTRAAVWGVSWFRHFPIGFCKAMTVWRETNPAAADSFIFAMTGQMDEGNGAWVKDIIRKGSAELRAVRLMYQWIADIVRVEDDPRYEPLRVYSITDRELAGTARDGILAAIANVSSEEAYLALDCSRRLNIDPPRRLKFDPGTGAAI